MYTVTKQYRTETGHRLMNYKGKCAHLHGHSYLWEVTVQSPRLDERGMVIDFKELKAVMEKILEPLDHAMLINLKDPILHVLKNMPATNGQDSRTLGVSFNPTAENMAYHYGVAMNAIFDASGGLFYSIYKIKLWETATSFAEVYLDVFPKSPENKS